MKDFNRNIYLCQVLQKNLSIILDMNRIKELRKSFGVTQKELAEAVGATQRNISYWEAGIEINASFASKIANYFDVSVDYLLGLEDDFGHKEEVIRRPPYEVTDKSLQNIIKLFGVMSELQKAHVLGYIVAYLEREGVNVGKVLGY